MYQRSLRIPLSPAPANNVIIMLKEYDHKDNLLFQKKGIGDTNILQQILGKSVD